MFLIVSATQSTVNCQSKALVIFLFFVTFCAALSCFQDYRNCFSSHASSELSSSINSLGSSELIASNPDIEPNSGSLSNSAPTSIEVNVLMQKLGSPPRPISVALSPPASNPVPIRASHHRGLHSISAPCSASASPSGSLHGSPRPGSWFPRMRSSNSTCSYGSSWYGELGWLTFKLLLRTLIGCSIFESVAIFFFPVIKLFCCLPQLRLVCIYIVTNNLSLLP